jgi:hypothetical protein
MVPFLIQWLLFSVAFMIGGYPMAPAPAPYNAGRILMCAVSGVLCAIAVAFVPGLVTGRLG